MATAENTAPEPTTGQLKRAIGPKLLFFFVIGDVLGTGIYALTGGVAGRIGGALWIPFLVAFVVAFLTAFSYLELSGKYPRAAGAALYTNQAFRVPFLTFLVAFTVMCSGITSASAAARAFGATYLPASFDIKISPTVIALVAVVFVLMLAAVNFIGVSESVKANVVLTIIELSGLVIIIAIGVFAVASGEGEPARLTEINTKDTTWLLAITAATSLAFFAMVGFEDSVNMAEECQDPPRIFPKALLWGLGAAAVIYILVAITSSLLIPADKLAAARSNALLQVVSVGAPDFPLRLFAFIGLFAVINSALINMLMASRLLYGMANERILPKAFGTVHPFRRTPWVAILVTTAIAAVLVSTAGADGVSKLGGTTALLLLIVFTVVNVAVLVLRRERVEHRHFVAPTWAPVLGAVLCGYLAIPVLSGRPAADYYIAIALISLGIVLWLINFLYLRPDVLRTNPAVPVIAAALGLIAAAALVIVNVDVLNNDLAIPSEEQTVVILRWVAAGILLLGAVAIMVWKMQGALVLALGGLAGVLVVLLYPVLLGDLFPDEAGYGDYLEALFSFDATGATFSAIAVVASLFALILSGLPALFTSLGIKGQQVKPLDPTALTKG